MQNKIILICMFFLLLIKISLAEDTAVGKTVVIDSAVEKSASDPKELTDEELEEIRSNLKEIRAMMARIDKVILETDKLTNKLDQIFKHSPDKYIACVVKENMQRQRLQALGNYKQETDEKKKGKLLRIFNSYDLAYKKSVQEAKNLICLD